MQKPDATLIAGYQSWTKNHGRQVRRGEKGIRIIAPSPYKVKTEQDVIDPKTLKPVLDRDGRPKKETVEVERPSGLPQSLMSAKLRAKSCRNLAQKS